MSEQASNAPQKKIREGSQGNQQGGAKRPGQDENYSEIHVRLLEEESRQRVKADFKEFDNITYIWITFFVVSLMGYRFAWENPDQWGWMADAPYFVWLTFGIIFPGLAFARFPRRILFDENRRKTKEKNIDLATTKNVQAFDDQTTTQDPMMQRLAEARALRIGKQK